MTLPAPINYSDKDFDSLRDRLFNLIRSVFPTWTDTSVANFANLIIESFAYIGDVLVFYQDKQARESRFGYTTLRKNMIALCKLLGYQLEGATAASADVVVTITNPDALTGAVQPSGGLSTPVIVRTDEVTDPVRGELDAPVSFAAGETQKTFTWRHVLTQPRFQVASTGRTDQYYELPITPFLDESEEVSTTIDGAYTRVTSFLSSGPTDRHYRVQVDQNDRARITFGDGINGKIPEGDILIDYKTGGGIVGNVEPGALKRMETQLVDVNGVPAVVTVTNALAATGGGPREEVNAARENAPASLRVLNRAVAREDYEIVANQVPGVGRSLMLTSNEDVTVGENRGKLYIIPTTGGDASTALINDTYGAFGKEGQPSPLPDGQVYHTTITFQLEVLTAAYLTVDVTATVFLADQQTASAVRMAILDALDDLFDPMLADGSANPAIDFGYNYKDSTGDPAGELSWSDVFNTIRDTAGVRKVDQGMTLNGAVDDVPLPNWQFPALGTVTLYNGDTGGTL
jgi:hypothetical protein